MLCCLTVAADNLTAKDGTVYRNVTIVSADPDRMLVVHDGGGCQVYFKDLADHSLTADQRKTVEEELRYYVKRTQRLEKIRAEQEAFELVQREKGRIEFEGGWVTPFEREEILLNREERKLELERKRIQLAKEKAQLEQELLQTEKARYLLEGESRRTTTFTYGVYSSYRGDCIYPVPYRHKKHWAQPKTRHSTIRSGCNNGIIYTSQNNPYICTDGASSYNRGPFNR